MDLSKKENSEAHVLLLSTLANAKLTFNDLDGTKRDMDAAWEVLDDLEGVDSMVNASYYGVAAAYYKVRNSFSLHLPLPCG
jgi:26S proteasome regulatory subunit N9